MAIFSYLVNMSSQLVHTMLTAPFTRLVNGPHSTAEVGPHGGNQLPCHHEQPAGPHYVNHHWAPGGAPLQGGW